MLFFSFLLFSGSTFLALSDPDDRTFSRSSPNRRISERDTGHRDLDRIRGLALSLPDGERASPEHLDQHRPAGQPEHVQLEPAELHRRRCSPDFAIPPSGLQSGRPE